MKTTPAVMFIAAMVVAAGLNAGYCDAVASAPASCQYERVYGSVEKIDTAASTITVRLKNAAAPAQALITAKLTEWTRVMREKEDLTVNDVVVGANVMLVYKKSAQGISEAATINLKEK